MPDLTKNYGFKKPKANEYAKPDDFNYNWEIADNKLKQMENIEKTIIISSDSWIDCAVAVNIADISIDSIVIVSPAPESIDDYVKAKVKCSYQSNGVLTFGCSIEPSVNINVNIVIMGR